MKSLKLKNSSSKVDQRLNIFDLTSKVIQWLVLSSREDKPSIPFAVLEHICSILDKKIKNRGIKHTIKFVKATRNNFYNYLSGNDLRDPLSKCYGDSQFPNLLGPLKKYIDDDNYEVIRLVLTILTATRALKIQSPVDTSSITMPPKGDPGFLNEYMTDFWKELGYRIHNDLLPRRMRVVDPLMYRLSRGPNGPALIGAGYEATILPDSLIRELDILAPGIAKIIEINKTNYVYDYQRSLGLCASERGLIRKTTSFPDKEGKMRTIGVVDYWTQMALKPMHSYLTNTVSKISQDCTLDQTKFKELIGSYRGGKFYSVDLSSATDRFPITLIADLLRVRFSQQFVDTWKKVMVGYPFRWEKQDIVYSAGTPMGAYTSFASFALTHHYIIYYLCRKNNVDWKSLQYCLLGDDIVICNDTIATKYMEILPLIGVEYSLAKTHSSENFYEFAKRVHYKHVEVSPFPISSLKESSKSTDTLVLLIHESMKKGWKFPSIYQSVESYFGILFNFRSKLRKKIGHRAERFSKIFDLMFNTRPAYSVFNDILGGECEYGNFDESMDDLITIVTSAYLKLLENRILKVNQFIFDLDLPVYRVNFFESGWRPWVFRMTDIQPDIQIGTGYLFSPIFKASKKLEIEVEDEIERVTSFVSNKSVVFDKSKLKPTRYSSGLEDLINLEKGRVKIVNTLREFYNILEYELRLYLQRKHFWKGFDNTYQIQIEKARLKDDISDMFYM